MQYETSYGSFRAVGYPLRLYSGAGALDNLGAELDRVAARHAFVICGRTVAQKTNLIQRIEALLGERLAGSFAEMDKDSSYGAVVAATEAARASQADLLIAVGGGSVIVGTRAVAIFLAEAGDPFDLMTQYPEGKPAHSPRLMAPKPPIINVVTTPTTAMNRAGTGLKNDDLDHRMEFFDPKTRPAALFWDSEALLTAPADLLRSTGTTTFTGALQGVAQPSLNPLVEGDRLHSLQLARQALPLALARPNDPAPRIDLCAAAFLTNRAADDDVGRRTERAELYRRAYALATALHLRYHQVGQGEATAALLPAAIRQIDDGQAEVARRLAEALGVARASMNAADAREAASHTLAAFYHSIGMPARLGELGIPREDLPSLAQSSVKNFNANPGERADSDYDSLLALLEAAW